MLPLLLAVTEVAAEPGMIEKFGIEPKYIVMQVISFLILFGVLYFFAIKPTIATMDARNQKIAGGLRHAEEIQVKLAAAQQESAQIIKLAQVESSKIIEEARKTAKEFLDRQMLEATQKAADTFTKAQHAIELEHRKMLAEARTEIARLVVVTAERVLAKQLSEADRAAYNQAAARELTVV